jgi:DNA-binding response OmpR family regulator
MAAALGENGFMNAMVKPGTELTPLEVKLIHFFSQNPDRVVGRGELIQHVWRNKPHATERMVDVAVSKLRRKLNRSQAKLITVYGNGYRWRPT